MTSEIIRTGTPVPCHPWPRHVLPRDAWRALAAAPHPALLALWADTIQVHALFQDGADILLASTDIARGLYPALSPLRPAAAWFERAIHDLWGHEAEGGTDLRPWLDHGAWAYEAPLAPRPGAAHLAAAKSVQPPDWLAPSTEDAHVLPLGPILPGAAEPAAFRLTASGDVTLRLETRLGYAHKGVLALMRGKSPRAAARFAARLSGEATVAHSIAFARAAEAATAVAPPPRALALRAVMAELERIAAHLPAIAALADPIPAARLGLRLETLRAAIATAFGHRLMMDCVIPGGVAGDLAPDAESALLAALADIHSELPLALPAPDRLAGLACVPPALAAPFAPGGPIGRASGRTTDTRRTPGYPPYDTLDFDIPSLPTGDAEARTHIRLAEIAASIALLRTLLPALPPGPLSLPLGLASGEGLGWAEGAAGGIWHWLRLDSGQIGAAFPADPAWLHWPLLEAAMANTQAADFPLALASFAPTVSGADL